ncbi:MAG: hypothetical protein EOP18_11855, partial [Rhizobiaceae bacterium]
TGRDITPVMLKVVDAAVARAYGGQKKIEWMEVLMLCSDKIVIGCLEPAFAAPRQSIRGGLSCVIHAQRGC